LRNFELRNLVAVAGHAIPRDFVDLTADASWYLKHFQAGEGGCYVDHIREGVRAASQDTESLLVFSGGQTDPAAGPRSEGAGYWLIADSFDWWGRTEVRDRATSEEFACDSFDNLRFSICRFREFAGAYPERITCVGWGFKEARFQIHSAALRFPADRFTYRGVNEPPKLEEALPFEAERRQLFEADPYGAGTKAAERRKMRNPFRRQHGYAASCPEIRQLLNWKGPSPYAEALPWAPAL
jgi:hypothetical protein